MAGVDKDKVANATLKMWKKIGEAFRDWSREVGARDIGNSIADQVNEAIDSIKKGARQVGVNYKGKKKKKKKKGSKRAKKGEKKQKSGSKPKKRSKKKR